MTEARALLLRAPSGERYRVASSEPEFTITSPTSGGALGLWILSAENDQRILWAIHNGNMAERVGDQYVFSCSLADVGEEVMRVRHIDGDLQLRISSSPAKCPLPLFRTYIQSYTDTLGYPRGQGGSLGAAEEPRGIPASTSGVGMVLLERALRLGPAVAGVVRDLAAHERDYGGATGIDVQRTLASWKMMPDWYEQTVEEGRGTVAFRQVRLRAKRTAPRYAREANRFTGAAIEVLRDVVQRIPACGVAALIKSILRTEQRRLERMDLPAFIQSRDALRLIQDNRLPRNSRRLGQLISNLREATVSAPTLSIMEPGWHPLEMAAPDVVFQRFATASVLRALGAPKDLITQAVPSPGPGPVRFSTYVAWIDRDQHPLYGWRATSSRPADYRPDLVVLRGSDGENALVVDVKFRRTDVGTGLVPSSALKEMQAYMQEFGLERIVVLVPHLPDDPLHEDVEAEGYHIRAIPVPPDALSKQRAGALADALVPMWTRAHAADYT